ncbi:MAG: hypothetical protein NC409_10975 [Clostridium sp.]|nr:hypothetical protein [Clostridium sp.]
MWDRKISVVMAKLDAEEFCIFMEQLQQTLKTETWIIDGNYSSTMELRMQFCDTVFFLDHPLALCISLSARFAPDDSSEYLANFEEYFFTSCKTLSR